MVAKCVNKTNLKNHNIHRIVVMEVLTKIGYYIEELE